MTIQTLDMLTEMILIFIHVSDKETVMSVPGCNLCKRSGAGVEFQVFSPHGFGTYCVECEEKLKEEDTNG